MRKTIVCLCLLAGFATVSLTQPAVVAQAKKGAPTKGGTIEVSEGKDGKWRFTVRNADGKFLANSGANNYATEKDAMKGVEDFKAAVASAKVTVGKKKASTKPAK